MKRFQLACQEAARATTVRTFVKHFRHRIRLYGGSGHLHSTANGQYSKARRLYPDIPLRSVHWARCAYPIRPLRSYGAVEMCPANAGVEMAIALASIVQQC